MADGTATNRTILVVGGGMSGLTAAVEAAEVGYEVILVEKNPYLGGRVAQLNKYFPKLCTPACGLEINFQRVRNNPRITFYTMTTVEEVKGSEGAFTVKLRQAPRFVNEKCTACGECAKACTVEVEDPFNFGQSKVKAIRNSHNMAFPNRFFMEAGYAKSEEARKLVSVCPVGAIEPEMQDRLVEVPVASIVWATGWKPYDAEQIRPYGYGRFPNVTTNMRFERMASRYGPTGGKIGRPSDGKEINKIAFIQCAGSRDHNYLPYCSYICCLASMKQTTYVREQYPNAEITIYYIDLRAMDRYEGFQKKIEADAKIRWIKSKPSRIDQEAGTENPIVVGENTLTGERYAETFDMVVLATGMEPNNASQPAPGVKVDEYRFVIGQEQGVYSCGCASGPLDVAKSVQSGTAAAMRAIQSVAKAGGR
ncbi:MAG: CoB--CoM heterodisulfide reductase iron-sulfur subunit A family protein [Magnetococcales bacterium]|nr:CoB--CoM heterodisulfide reductase iron-sulfur subunit A family protein [Magnetococcales bacterium]